MLAFTKEEIDALYAPFPLTDHITREGNTVRDGAGIQWFTYLDRAAVQRRLETLFPGEWSVDIIETHREAKYVTVSLRMTIRGISRACNGGQSLNGPKDVIDEDKEKGAWTEAFRRVASVWGIGLYVYESDFKNYTDNYVDTSGKKDWKKRDAAQAEAEGKFAQWYKRQFPTQSPENGNRPTPPQPTTTGQPMPAQPTPSTNGKHEDAPAQPKNAAPVTPVTMVVNNDTKIEALNKVKIEAFGKNGRRMVTSTGSVSYTRKPFTDAGIDTELWTEPGVVGFGKPFNVVSVWHQPEDPKAQSYWRIDRLEPIGAAEAELFGPAPEIAGDF